MSDTRRARPAWKQQLCKRLWRLANGEGLPLEAGQFVAMCMAVLLDVEDDARIPELTRALQQAAGAR